MRLRILLSFHYYRKTDIERLVASFPEPPEVFADSGAFSAKSVGADVTVGEYATWLRQWGHLFVAAANLDVIGNAAATLENQRRMEDRGFAVLPVFHGGEPWEYLHDYCGRYPYVALGGMVATGGAPAVLRWAVQAFRVAREHGTVFHGFGQTTVPILKQLPWYSVDSSTWGSGHRYGQLALWDDDRARFVQVQLGDHVGIYKLAPLIRQHGGNPARLATPRFSSIREGVSIEQVRTERAHVIAVNVCAWLRLEAWLQRRHGPVSAGPRVYFADTDTDTDNLRAAAGAAAGPKVYFAEGVERNLQAAAHAVSKPQEAEE